MWKLDVYVDAGRKCRWRLIAGNGENVASSGESFSSEQHATDAASNFKSKVASWDYEVYDDAAGEFRWRAKSSNGHKVASSGEAFASKQNAQRAADNVRDNAGGATGP